MRLAFRAIDRRARRLLPDPHEIHTRYTRGWPPLRAQVPNTMLPEPSSWSQDEKLWVWNVTPEDKLFLDLENQARFRVVQAPARCTGSRWQPHQSRQQCCRLLECKLLTLLTPKQVNFRHQGTPTALKGAPDSTPTMGIVAALDKSGLGLLSWWPPADEGEEGMEDAEGYDEQYEGEGGEEGWGEDAQQDYQEAGEEYS